jgi:predicted RNase H-like HicB family nuclease
MLFRAEVTCLSINFPVPAPQRMLNKIETELETDGRWLAEIVDVPGVLANGATEKEAIASAQALALCVLADRIDNN